METVTEKTLEWSLQEWAKTGIWLKNDTPYRLPPCPKTKIMVIWMWVDPKMDGSVLKTANWVGPQYPNDLTNPHSSWGSWEVIDMDLPSFIAVDWRHCGDNVTHISSQFFLWFDILGFGVYVSIMVVPLAFAWGGGRCVDVRGALLWWCHPWVAFVMQLSSR